MHCVTLADLAATISQHAPAICCHGGAFPPQSLAGYWASCRGRLELWQQSLGQYQRTQQAGDWAALRRWWNEQTVVLEEILVSEVLTRVLASVGMEIDRRSGVEEIAPVTDAVHRGHLEARTRVQQVMIDGRGCRVPEAVRLNRLRHGAERWTDVMIGRMAVGNEAIARYAVEPERAEAYAEEAHGDGRGSGREISMWLMNAAMHDMLARRTVPVAALPQANRRIADSVLRMLPQPLFDSLGTLKSTRLRKIDADPWGSDRELVEPILGPPNPSSPTTMPPDETSNAKRERWYL